MNKKLIGIVVAVIVACVAAIAAVAVVVYNRNGGNLAQSETANDNLKEEDMEKDNDKTLVVYYSAQNHTEAVAKQIAENLSVDIFEVVPKEVYTAEDLDWTDTNSRVTREHEDESLRDVELETTVVPNWENYDTVLIGYPIWWGIAAWPIDNFVKNNDFTGKTIIPFCTSSSSGMGESGEILKSYANGGDWQEGERFSSSASASDIKAFTDSVKQKAGGWPQSSRMI